MYSSNYLRCQTRCPRSHQNTWNPHGSYLVHPFPDLFRDSVQLQKSFQALRTKNIPTARKRWFLLFGAEMLPRVSPNIFDKWPRKYPKSIVNPVKEYNEKLKKICFPERRLLLVCIVAGDCGRSIDNSCPIDEVIWSYTIRYVPYELNTDGGGFKPLVYRWNDLCMRPLYANEGQLIWKLETNYIIQQNKELLRLLRVCFLRNPAAWSHAFFVLVGSTTR
jgi:hypothetical protein